MRGLDGAVDMLGHGGVDVRGPLSALPTRALSLSDPEHRWRAQAEAASSVDKEVVHAYFSLTASSGGARSMGQQ